MRSNLSISLKANAIREEFNSCIPPGANTGNNQILLHFRLKPEVVLNFVDNGSRKFVQAIVLARNGDTEQLQRQATFLLCSGSGKRRVMLRLLALFTDTVRVSITKGQLFFFVAFPEKVIND